MFPFNASPMQMMVDAMSRYLSPYDLNPLNINPLKDLIERFVDFEAIRSFTELDLFISATNVHSGRLRVFTREEITADVVMASAALPLMFRAVEIDGVPYWDGGFTGNPAILPLIEANEIDDVLVVQISPLSRETTPTSVRDIMHRMNEITFNSSLDTELRALEYIGRVDRRARQAQDRQRRAAHQRASHRARKRRQEARRRQPRSTPITISSPCCIGPASAPRGASSKIISRYRAPQHDRPDGSLRRAAR